jgi:hypothetical protein
MTVLAIAGTGAVGYLAGAVITYNLLPNGYRGRPSAVLTYCGLWPVYAVIWGVAIVVERIEQ